MSQPSAHPPCHPSQNRYKKGSPEFEAETQELLKYGGVVSERTAYQNDTAKFWLGEQSGFDACLCGTAVAALRVRMYVHQVVWLRSVWPYPPQPQSRGNQLHARSFLTTLRCRSTLRMLPAHVHARRTMAARSLAVSDLPAP